MIDVNNSSNEIDDLECPDNSVVDESSEQLDSGGENLPVELPGSLLKKARQKSGLSLSEVATELYMSVRKLEALERDDYGALPSAVFVHGYIKKYSAIVKEDEDALLASYDQYLKTQREINPASMQVNIGVEKRKKYSFLSLKWLVPAGLFAASVSILVIVMSFTQQQRPDFVAEVNEAEQLPESPVSELDSNVLDEMASELDSIRDQNDDPIASAELALARELNASGIQEPENQPAEAPTNNQQTNTSAGVDADVGQGVSSSVAFASDEMLDELFFRISEDCWIEVSDSNGSKIYSNLANAGQTVSLDGEGPFSVMLGNARAVELSINGESVLINTRPGRDTARLIVGK